MISQSLSNVSKYSRLPIWDGTKESPMFNDLFPSTLATRPITFRESVLLEE